MTVFFRFPRTPHLAWLGEGRPRDDKVLLPAEAKGLLNGEIVVEEKIDGANLGFSVGDDGALRIQNRGTYLSPEASIGQFKPLKRWLQSRESELIEALRPGLMLFGEWCYAVHGVHYTRLPDWFLAFDVYETPKGHFWSATRRNAFVGKLGLAVVPTLAVGRFDMPALTKMMTASTLTDGPPEGIYVRRDTADYLDSRAKLVRREFAQSMDVHWSRRTLKTNRLAASRAF